MWLQPSVAASTSGQAVLCVPAMLALQAPHLALLLERCFQQIVLWPAICAAAAVALLLVYCAGGWSYEPGWGKVMNEGFHVEGHYARQGG